MRKVKAITWHDYDTDQNFSNWWESKKFNSPTFFDCYIKGFNDGLTLKPITKRRKKP